MSALLVVYFMFLEWRRVCLYSAGFIACNVMCPSKGCGIKPHLPPCYLKACSVSEAVVRALKEMQGWLNFVAAPAWAAP